MAWFRGIAENIGAREHRWMQKLIAAGGSVRLSDSEIVRMAADAGLTRNQISAEPLRSGFRRRMTAMMRHFRVDPGSVPLRYRGALRDAERVCASCSQARRCRRWFAAGCRRDAARIFCPNAALYDEITRNQAQDPAAKGASRLCDDDLDPGEGGDGTRKAERSDRQHGDLLHLRGA